MTDRVMDADDENCRHKLNFEAALLFLAGRRWQPWVSLNLSCRKTEMISSFERILRLFGLLISAIIHGNLAALAAKGFISGGDNG